MACRYTYQGKTFEAHEFDDVLKSLPPAVAAKYIPSIKSTPDAPFIGKDPKPIISLALKRMIRYAVDNGFDRIAMVTGEQSAERYDLSKQISKVEYLPHNSTLRAFDLGGNGVYDKVTEPDKIEDVIGKDAAKKLLESQPYTTGSGKAVHRLEGLDLKVGGEGMKAFYDKIVPNVANDVLKKLGGGKVSEVTIAGGQKWRKASASMENLPPSKQPGFDITDKMREQAAQGMPLFQRARPTRATLSTAEDGTPQIDGDTITRESFGASPAGKNAGTDSGGARIAESQDRRAITAKRNPALSTPPETTALLRRLSVLESIRTCLG